MMYAKLSSLADKQAETISGGCWMGNDDFGLFDEDHMSDGFMSQLFYSADSFEQRTTSINQNRISQVYVSRVSINI